MAKLPVKSEQKAVTEFLGSFDGVGDGLENVTAADILIPRLTILQGLSPQVNKAKPEYDEKARVGMIYDVGLQQIFGDSVIFLPVHFIKQYLEWAPRASGKGLVKIHENKSILDECEPDERGKPCLPNGNLIAETAQFFGLNVSANYRKSFIPMSSTQLKHSRRLLTLATEKKLTRADGAEFTPPLFYQSYKLSTVPESNAEGDWMGWKIEPHVPVTQFDDWKKLVESIKSFRASLTSGTIAGDISTMGDESQGSATSGAM